MGAVGEGHAQEQGEGEDGGRSGEDALQAVEETAAPMRGVSSMAVLRAKGVRLMLPAVWSRRVCWAR